MKINNPVAAEKMITDKELEEIKKGMEAGQVSLSADYVKKILTRLRYSESQNQTCPSCGQEVAQDRDTN